MNRILDFYTKHPVRIWIIIILFGLVGGIPGLIRYVPASIGIISGGWLHIGDETNYTQAAGDGVMTFHGDARPIDHISFAGATFSIGAPAPDGEIVGNYSAWSFDINDDSVFSFELPTNWAAGTDLTVKIDWGINRDEITESAEVQWHFTWSAVPHDGSEVLTGGGTLVDVGDVSIPTDANTLFTQTLGTIAGASLAAEDEIGITLERVALDGGANPGNNEDPYIIHLHVEYLKGKP